MSIKSKRCKPWSRNRTLWYIKSEITGKAGYAREGIYTLVSIPQESGQTRLFLRDFVIEGVSILASLSGHTQEFRKKSRNNFKIFLLLILNACEPIMSFLSHDVKEQLNYLNNTLREQMSIAETSILTALIENPEGQA